MVSQKPMTNRGFFASLADYLKITFEGIGSLGDSVIDSGQVWMVELDASGKPSEPKQIGSFSDMTWPIIGPDGSTLYALRGGRIVRIENDGRSSDIRDAHLQWIKLLGVAQDGSVLGLVSESGETKPAMIAPNGDVQVSSSPLSDDEKKRVAELMQETRSYAGGRILSVDPSLRGGRGFDVFLRTGNNTVNLSNCGDDSCGQASLAADFRRAVFIRQPRY